MTPKRVTVIGAAGYLGSVIALCLAEHGYRVRAVDGFIYGHSWTSAMRHAGIALVEADYRSVDALETNLSDTDVCVHMGGLVGEPACQVDPLLAVELTYTSVVGAALVAQRLGVPEFICASSCSVYGTEQAIVDETTEPVPIGLYAAMKVGVENAVSAIYDDSGRAVFPRFGTAFGLSPRPRLDTAVNMMSAHAALGLPIVVNGGQQVRPFVHVKDIAESIRTFLTTDVCGPVNVGSSASSVTISGLADLVASIIPQTEVVHHYDAENVDPRHYHVDFDKIGGLGYRTKVPLIEGVREIAEAVRVGMIRNVKDARYSNIESLRAALACGTLSVSASSWLEQIETAYPLPGVLR